MKKKKKGFTLIELLAVIVILAVIALIATPLIMGIINDAKEESVKRSVEQIQSTAETMYATGQIKNPNYIFNQADVKYKGEQYENISMSVNDKGDASIAVYKDNKCYYALNGERNVTVIGGDKEGCLARTGAPSCPPVEECPSSKNYIFKDGTFLVQPTVNTFKLDSNNYLTGNGQLLIPYVKANEIVFVRYNHNSGTYIGLHTNRNDQYAYIYPNNTPNYSIMNSNLNLVPSKNKIIGLSTSNVINLVTKWDSGDAGSNISIIEIWTETLK